MASVNHEMKREAGTDCELIYESIVGILVSVIQQISRIPYGVRVALHLNELTDLIDYRQVVWFLSTGRSR